MKNKNTPKLRFPEFTDEWEKIKVKDLGQDKNSVIAGPFGSNLKVEDYVDVGIPVLRTQNIERNNFIKMGMVYTSKEKAYELKYHSYVPGDIVFAKLGNPIGKTCRIPFNFEKGLVVADVVRIRPDVQKYSYDFITYSLNSPIIEKEIVMETIGSTRQRLNLSQVRNLKFSISSLKEQTKIAKFLSKVDEKINSLNEKYVEFLNFKKFLMQNLFT
ncbi:MAG: restriction endonuclease subunit S, partial [Methanobacteriaceae archaeon]|nr:restriction endonuclease subunit S [Methanobacteriaceae archaeon]